MPGVAVGVENRARAEQCRGVYIVPAGMHCAIGGGEGDAGFLGHREGIKISPHQRGWAVPVAEDSDDAMAADSGDELALVLI